MANGLTPWHYLLLFICLECYIGIGSSVAAILAKMGAPLVAQVLGFAAALLVTAGLGFWYLEVQIGR